MRRLWLATAAYVAILGILAIARWNLWTYGTDTGTFSQVVADAFGGFRDGPEQGTHFRFHWAPLLAVLWPVVALFRSGLGLQLAQVVAIAATALPLYGIARVYTSEDRAATYATLALLYTPLTAVAFTEFHEIAFYPALALAIVWAAERARWAWFAPFAVLGACVREEACIVLAIVGVVFAVLGIVRRSRPDGAVALNAQGGGLLAGSPLEPERLAAAGVFLCVANVAALGIYYLGIIPHVGPWQPSRFYDYGFAHGPSQVVVALLTHPGDAGALFQIGRLTYLLEALTPLAFLPLFSRWSLLAVPGLAVVLLSSDGIAWRMGSHYAAIWAPWLLLGAVATLLAFERERRDVAAMRWFGTAAACCTIFLIAIDPMHPFHYLRTIYAHGDAARALATVPRDAHLLTHDEWFTHVAYDDRNATVFFCPFVDYVVVADDYPNEYYQRTIAPEIAREVASGRMHVAQRFGHVHAYTRTPSPGARPGDCITPGDVRYKDLPSTLGTGGSPAGG